MCTKQSKKSNKKNDTDKHFQEKPSFDLLYNVYLLLMYIKQLLSYLSK